MVGDGVGGPAVGARDMAGVDGLVDCTPEGGGGGIFSEGARETGLLPVGFVARLIFGFDERLTGGGPRPRSTARVFPFSTEGKVSAPEVL